MTNDEAVAAVRAALAAGKSLAEIMGEMPGVQVSMRTMVEKREAASGRLTERVIVEDDGSTTVETF